MLVFGDREERQDPRAKLARLGERLTGAAGPRTWLERHAALTGAFIEAGELVQGLADLACNPAGAEVPSPAADAAMDLCLALAAEVGRSWRGSGETGLDAARRIETLQRSLPLEALRIRIAEGYAYYALYPEAYLLAALQAGPAPRARVIGIRSIGAGLAAMVATGLAAAGPITVRPVGDPFDRRLSLGPELKERLAAPAPLSAIVDEGPGLSGSSFGAVVKALEAAGAPADSIEIFPSHPAPPGEQAPAWLSRRWPKLRRRCIGFEALALGRSDGRGLEQWAADLIGEPEAPLEDVSAGGWRSRLFQSEADWPPVWPAQERRKYLVRTASGAWLLKFAGLGAEGETKLARARALEAAGFGPETAGLRHGFLVQRWIEGGARPLTPGPRPPDLAARLGGYLGFRARAFPAGSGSGASVAALCRMARCNAAAALGEGTASRLERWERAAGRIAAELRPVEIDGRLHAWEWLHEPGGRLIKTDALDHCRSHDLVGCQDIAWDIAGAGVELGLGPGEREALRLGVERECGRPVSPQAVRWLRVPYLAFQLGRSVMAAQGCGGLPRESVRLRRAAGRYAHLLERSLEAER